MDLLSFVRKIWRYKYATLPIVLLTGLGAAYAITVKKPVYEASASYILINPPAPPTAVEIARDPSLRRVDADNPYTRYSDQSVLAQALATTVSSPSVRDELARKGADRRYKVGRAAEFESSSPTVQITGIGSTPGAAVRTAKVVGSGLLEQLDGMQREEGVDPRYRIKTYQVTSANRAELRASAQARTLVGVLGLGAILTFLTISARDAVSTFRKERRALRALESFPDPESRSDGDSRPDQERDVGAYPV